MTTGWPPGLLQDDSRELGRSSQEIELPQWQPIETAPKDRRIDLLVGGRRHIGCYWDQICGEYRTIDNGGILIRLRGATHWMPEPPLPEPPKA